MTKSDRPDHSEVRGQKLMAAAREAIEHGDLERAATAHNIAPVGLMRFMRSGPHYDEMLTEHGELAAAKLARTGQRKGAVAEMYVDLIERIGGEIQKRLDHGETIITEDGVSTVPTDAETIERLMKAAGMATDKLLLVLGDPTVIQATTASVELARSQTQHSEILARLAERAGIAPPEAIEATRIED